MYPRLFVIATNRKQPNTHQEHNVVQSHNGILHKNNTNEL
jgi:hypothetical protein